MTTQTIPTLTEQNIASDTIPIIYQDEDLVVINKPAGWLVHRSWLDRKETKIIMQQVRDQIGKHVYTVHRLDKPTSGLLVLALNKAAAHHLSLQFEEQTPHKTYFAIVRGYLLGQDRIDYPLVEELDKIADKFATQERVAQSAVTDYESIATCEMPVSIGKYDTARYSLIKLNPVTGRKHQLRRHLSHLRHPIIGDSSHGDLKQNRGFVEAFSAPYQIPPRLFLHASELKILHPTTEQLMVFSAPIENEGDWKIILQQFGWLNVK